MTDTLNTQAAIDAGIALGEPKPLDKEVSAYSVIVPAGATHHTVRTPPAHPDFTDSPLRARGVYRPATVDALIAVINRHHDPAATTIWVHQDSGRVEVVFNDAAPGTPAWRDHRAVLTLTQTPEWKHWLGKDNRLMDQNAFAEHIEDGLGEIVEPTAADMLELAQTFQAHTSATFRSGVRLSDGRVQFQYDEEIETKAGTSGQMQVPSTFTLAISPFLGEEPYRIEARFRHRQSSGKLTLGYKLDRPHVVVDDALKTIRERLSEKFPAVFIGEPGN
ncbi:MAG TPA: DUF2303 family protein [Gemmatimonadales bacterium]|nr:DUF2303 family protein [Gemmatimonadales bacterium]